MNPLLRALRTAIRAFLICALPVAVFCFLVFVFGSHDAFMQKLLGYGASAALTFGAVVAVMAFLIDLLTPPKP